MGQRKEEKKGEGEESIPAWMEAQALTVKAKNVLIEEAIDLLYKEIEAKRMAIHGKFMPMELERSGEMEQGLFLIRNLVLERESIIRNFTENIDRLEARQRLTKTDVEKIDAAKKFIVSVEKITALADYGSVFAQWFDAASLEVKEKDPARILAKTSGGAKSHRTQALQYLVKSKMFNADGLFVEREKKQLAEALSLCEKRGGSSG